MMLDEVYKQLSEPFPVAELLFRVGGKATEGGRCRALAYIDARMVMDRLDSVVGPDHWSFDWEPLDAEGHAVKGKLTVCGVLHADTGQALKEEELWKSSVSDALKRCAVHFGIGRELYAFGTIWVAAKVVGPNTYFADDLEPMRVLTQLLSGRTPAKPAAKGQPEQAACADCTKPITGYTNKAGKVYTAADVERFSVHDFGLALCKSCSWTRIEAQKAPTPPADAQEATEPTTEPTDEDAALMAEAHAGMVAKVQALTVVKFPTTMAAALWLKKNGYKEPLPELSLDRLLALEVTLTEMAKEE